MKFSFVLKLLKFLHRHPPRIRDESPAHAQHQGDGLEEARNVPIAPRHHRGAENPQASRRGEAEPD